MRHLITGVHNTISPIELNLIIKTLDWLDIDKDITQINGISSNLNFEYLSFVKSIVIQVFGKVQGVWFRASTKEKAEELNIKGEVKNLNDGSVLIAAEGTVKDVINFSRWCETGPEFAQVKEIKIQDTELKNYDKFKIVRV